MSAIHLVSTVHLCLVAAFLALYACETIVEGSHAEDELHPTAIRIHYLIDTILEVPLMVGIFATGVILSFQVEEITTLHAWLIACGTLTVFTCVFAFLRTRVDANWGTTRAVHCIRAEQISDDVTNGCPPDINTSSPPPRSAKNLLNAN